MRRFKLAWIRPILSKAHPTTRLTLVLVLAPTLSGLVALAHPQRSSPRADDRIRIAQRFIAALYPQFEDKHYTLTVEASFPLNDPRAMPNYLTVDIGPGPKSFVASCCLGGTVGGVLVEPPSPDAGFDPSPSSPQYPPPPKLEPPPPHVPKSAPVRPVPSQPLGLDWDSQGAGHFKQYLHCTFFFGAEGRLEGFSANGPEAANRDADEALNRFYSANPQATEGQIIAEMKRLGVRYGPNDKDQFTHNLPINQLESFLGKLQIVSVAAPSFEENRGDPILWKYWSVRVRARQHSGAILDYQLAFDGYIGNLTSLRIIPAAQLTDSPSH